MEIAQYFQIGSSALLAFSLYHLKRQDDEMKGLRDHLHAHTAADAAVHMGLSDTFARRDDMQEIVTYLRRIEDKLDRKMDKP